MARERAKEKASRLRLDDAMNKIFLRIEPERARQLFSMVREEAKRRNFFYEDDEGSLRTINIMIRPRAVTRQQRRYFHGVCLEMKRALEKLYPLYMENEQVRALLPLEPEEERWMVRLWPKLSSAPQRIFGRLDANADFAALDSYESFHFFEPNSVAIGGIYFTTVAEQIIHELVVSHMRRVDPELSLTHNDDARVLLLKELKAHAQQIGRACANVALVQDRFAWGGPAEFGHLCQYYASNGINAVHVDPRELRLRGDQVYYQDTPIDMIYRDVELRELTWMEEEGEDLSALLAALERNQVVSTLSGDFDHKSAWEVFTDPRFARYFTPRQRQVFRRHLPWTRLLSERKTTDADGRGIDLIPYVRRNKDRLVLKPNREYGGSGVVIGPLTDLAAWERELEKALAEPNCYIVQSYVNAPIEDYPVLQEDGSIALTQFYVVCGFYVTAQGISILGRASKRCVVNVAQQGGLAAVLLLD